MLPIGPSSGRLLNQSTHSNVANSTTSKLGHGPRRWMPIQTKMIVDERNHRLNGRSKGTHARLLAWDPSDPQPSNQELAKQALALRNISLACRSSRTSRSSAFIFAAMFVVRPGLPPLSTSTLPIHCYSDCGAQPILEDTETMAAHRDGCPFVIQHHTHHSRAYPG